MIGRAIAARELPNLLAAVHGALDADAPWAVEFADGVSRFLTWFGLSRDWAALNERVQAAAVEKGSESWYIARSNLGDQLYAVRSFHEAEAVFADVLAHLDEAPSYERCATLVRLGRCYNEQGAIGGAKAIYRRALAEAGQLEPTYGVRRLIGMTHTNLGDVLADGGEYGDARVAYEASLAIKKEVGGDSRGVAVALGQLGYLAVKQGNLSEAESRYRQALETFRTLGEPSSEATVWHQLGVVYQQANRLQEAEHAYRESARIEEEHGNRAGAAQSWGQIARVMALAGQTDHAEAWYVKALQVIQAEGDQATEALFSHSIAALLLDRPARLADARAYAERALAIKKTLDPAAAEIWTTYEILAKIAGKAGEDNSARGYRGEARASYAAAPVGQETFRRYGDLVKSVVAAVVDSSRRPALDEVLSKLSERGWTKLVEALRRILDRERDEDALCERLDSEDSAIVGAALRGIADPESLKAIPSPEPATKDDGAADVARQPQKHFRLIGAAIAAAGEPELRPQLDPVLHEMEQHGWSNLVASVRRILNGERSGDALFEGLDAEDTLIIRTILTGIENPK